MRQESALREALVSAFEAILQDEPDITVFNGLPRFVDGEDELPALAVHLTDIEPEQTWLDASQWQAILHVMVFVRANTPDTVLDSWADEVVFPVVAACEPLHRRCISLELTGYRYERSQEAATWAALDVQYTILFQ